MLAISLRQRNDGQLSCLNRSVLGVRKGTRRMERETAAWIRSMAMASRSRRLPCQTGDAYSSFGRRKYKIDEPIPFTSEAHFRSHDVLWQGQTKAFSVQWRKVSPLFRKVMALWSEHYALNIALSLATLS